ncbi:exopolysaccharide biosynthesis polyprenyl glycosylphosphotransferase [Dethiosulfatibacter aminovorans DSM 17477]|uniref:Exopolysaccharide biosynthesis polyprenyl glycosylphosphotransferase n=1 Tax=Dethiosulfatibacter aminovorans DSM 17477 TaxID=1121476 RepID=A0A1M6BNW9_9FIRM|nr:sugar transferase [Dethiosulfatibacter aminovorans]SHI50451.1 exopolysaccharide biosynthesis polyprenyl glycosylphosphotransferase [Dethiosulfatibacter aminovorans DSM 17477]
MIRNSNKNKLFFTIQFIIDYLTVVVGLGIAYAIAAGELGFAKFSFEEVIAIVTVFSFVVFSIYKPHYCGKKKYLDSMYNSIFSIIAIHVIVITLGYIFKRTKIPAGVFAYSMFFSFIVFAIQKKVMFKLYQKIHIKERSIVIGTTDDKEMITIKLIKHLDHLYDVRYILDSETLRKKMLLEYIEESETVFISNKVDAILKGDIIKYCYMQNKEVFAIPTTLAVFNNTAEFTTLDDMPVFSFSNRISNEEMVLKRAVDIVLSTVGLLVLSPVMLASGIAVKVQDGGTVFFRQTRLTKNNMKFDMVKFRTMIENAEALTGAVIADENDSRITRVGKFLRMTRIDELPQLINVLKGEMSIVGPRPERPEIAEKFTEEYDEFGFRTKFKAGITGLAQVRGKYNTALKDKLIYDLYYINNYSIFLDVQIMFYTLKVIFMKSSTEGLKKAESLKDTARKNDFDVRVHDSGVIEVVR